VVEFALVLPLILLVALAMVQLAVVGRDRLILEHAALVGAREAAVDPDDAAVRSVVASALAPLDPADVSLSFERGGVFGAPVVVHVAYDAPLALPLAGWLLPPSVHLSADLSMRQEFG